MPQTIKASDGTELDAGVVNLAKAIRQRESKGDYTAVGDAGTSKGAYQWQPNNFESAAKQYGLDPADFSPKNQDKVAYYQVKALKDKGYTPAQVAASWNAGEGKVKDDAWKKNVGDTTINGKTIHYDTPAYVDSVVGEFQKLKGTASPAQPKPDAKGYVTTSAVPDVAEGTQPAPEEDNGFIGNTASDLNKRVTEGVTAASDIIPAITGHGKQNVVSDVLQTAGAAAGAVGDVTNRALESTPIVGSAVKGIEGLIGKGVGWLAKTDTGKSVLKSVSDWSDAHPELSKDIGAGFNIVTAIPILKGLSVVKNVVGDTAAQVLKGVAEKGATKDLEATAARTIGGRKALADTPEGIKTLVNERAIPDIENGRYITKEASEKLDGAISSADDKMDAILQKTIVNGAKPVVDVTALKNQALASAKAELEGSSNYKTVVNKINELFDTAEASDKAINIEGSKFLTLEDANFFKRQARKGLKWDDTIGRDAGFHVGQSYMKGVEEIAAKNGLGDVHAANQITANLLKAQNMLRFIEGKPVKTGTMGNIIKDAATAGGEVVGNMTGIPFAGTLLGREGGGYISKKMANITNGILNRTGKDAVKTPLKTAAKKVTKGLVGAGAQNSTKNP